MTKDTPPVQPETKRTPASDLLLDFLKQNKISIIVDEVPTMRAQVDKIIYAMEKVPRIRALYLDELVEKNKDPKVEVAN